MDGTPALESGDPVRLVLLSAVVRRALKVRQDLHDDQAYKIAERIGELFTDK